ncbi:uncharacterized protein L203_104958 [Cryptococcus depauperatus CBS 7841]|uniref:Serine aminopeptidase S33 domain-containing protein n=1 Tax=Cryptococcus depauperatus CBS 7841 TaxID=1295531 RepID=A0AAJ8M304_9TREE
MSQAQWSSTGEIRAHVVFVHGFAEHIERYSAFFARLAPLANLNILAFDQRGYGRTSQAPLTASSPEVKKWREEGQMVKLEKNGKRRTGGWGKVFSDIEWFLKKQSERARGKPLFLWGFSMGGGEVLAFPIRPTPPPSQDTVRLLSGVIAGGPLIRLYNPAPSYQVKAGTIAANLGLGSFVIPTPIDYTHLSHNSEINEKAKADPFCEQTGSLRGVGDMINGGAWLDSSDAWERWPHQLPVLLYHGGEDNICHVAATKRFAEGIKSVDKTIKIFEGMYHEVHNELEPVPTKLIQTITEWINARTPTTTDAAQPLPSQSKL